jgi:hypothetical protein
MYCSIKDLYIYKAWWWPSWGWNILHKGYRCVRWKRLYFVLIWNTLGRIKLSSAVESSIKFNRNAFSVFGANIWSNLKWTVSKHKVTTVLTHYSHRYLRRYTVTHTSVFYRNLLCPSSLFSSLEMEDVGFSKKADIPTTQKTLTWICEYSGHKNWVPHLTITLRCQIFQHYCTCLVKTCISNWTDCRGSLSLLTRGC